MWVCVCAFWIFSNSHFTNFSTGTVVIVDGRWTVAEIKAIAKPPLALIRKPFAFYWIERSLEADWMFIAHARQLRVDTLMFRSRLDKCNKIARCFVVAAHFRLVVQRYTDTVFVTVCRTKKTISDCSEFFFHSLFQLQTVRSRVHIFPLPEALYPSCAYVCVYVCVCRHENSWLFRRLMISLYMSLCRWPCLCLCICERANVHAWNLVWLYRVRLPLTASLNKFTVPFVIHGAAPLRFCYSSDKEQDDEKEIQLGNPTNGPKFKYAFRLLLPRRITRLVGTFTICESQTQSMYNSRG